MAFSRYEPFSVGQVDTPITMLHHFGMNRFVCKINEKRFVMPPLDELNCVPIQKIGNVPARAFTSLPSSLISGFK